MPVTTIAVDPATHQKLGRLKEEWKAASYGEVIDRLIARSREIPRSMFGVDPDLPSLDRRERTAMWGGERTRRGK